MRPALSLLTLFCTVAFAQVPQQIGYQGRLLKSDGKPEVGSVNITFSLFDTATGGSARWTETQALALVDGYYATFLGQNVPLDGSVFSDGAQKFLEISIGGTALSPRQKLASVPYAYRAREVSGGSVNASSIAVAGNPVVDATGQVLPSALASLGQTGTINSVDNPVDWTMLKNVPAGFADGTDEGGSSGTSIPPGTIVAFAGLTAPAGWLLCNGAAVSRTAYADLFTIIGTAYGAGDNFNTFNLPDLQQRFPRGVGSGVALAAKGGASDHAHGMAHSHPMPHTHGMGHTHTIDAPRQSSLSGNSFNSSCSGGGGINCGGHTHDVDLAPFTSGQADAGSGSTSTQGSSATSTQLDSRGGTTDQGSTLPPFLVLHFVIKT